MRLKSLTKFLAALAFIIGLTHLSQSVAFGQCPQNGSANIQSVGWQKGTQVAVFIDPAIIGDARTAAEQAFRN